MNRFEKNFKRRWKFWLVVALTLLFTKWGWMQIQPYNNILKTRNKSIINLVYNIDGTRMAGIRNSRNDNHSDEIIVWDVNRYKQIYSLPIHDSITSLVFIRHNTIAFIHIDDYEGENPYSLTVVNIETGDTFHNHDLADEQFSLSVDHQYLFTITKSDETYINIWNTENWQITNAIPISQERGYSMPMLNPQKTLLALVVDTYPYEIRFWNFDTGEFVGSMSEPTSSNHHSRVSQKNLQTSPPAYADIEEINFSPDGKQLVSCGPNTGFKLWNVETMQLVWESSKAGSTCFFHPSGKFIIFQGLNGSIVFIDTQNGEEIIEPLSIIRFPKFSIFETGTIPFLPFAAFNYLAHPNEYNIFISATLSPDEKTLTIGSDSRFGVYLYDLTSILPEEYFEE